ncbi:MAG: hypothetical protein UX07_C0010G0002 [Parcubacteria group bacterium GW2011_GWA2_45_30]|nr:MAG: hypothetical protein UX07_C0010G0002 [Parcubacteria group bacterium GW2011_GWA2_45_30]
MEYIREFTETCCICGEQFTGQKIADSKEELDKTGLYNAVEKTLLLETCRACLDKEELGKSSATT